MDRYRDICNDVDKKNYVGLKLGDKERGKKYNNNKI